MLSDARARWLLGAVFLRQGNESVSVASLRKTAGIVNTSIYKEDL